MPMVRPNLVAGRRLARAVATAAVALLASVLAGCTTSDRMSTFDPFGPVADMQYRVFMVTLWVSLGIFVVVGSLLVFAVFRFRVKGDIPHDRPLPPQTHGNATLEVALTLISVLLLVIIAVPTVKGIFMSSEMPTAENTLVVNVTGVQWWWIFEYPDPNNPANTLRTANELVIPVGRPVLLNLKTADVIHSFWVPKLAGKVDLIPNQYNRMWLTADRTGWYYGQCAEFCGESHANMRFKVRAVYEPDFATWMGQQKAAAPPPTTSLAQEGMRIFMRGPREGMACSSCHTIRGTKATGLVGPDLSHVASRSSLGSGMLLNDHDNLRKWLHDFPTVKPGNKMATTASPPLKLSEEEINALTAYLETLK